VPYRPASQYLCLRLESHRASNQTNQNNSVRNEFSDLACLLWKAHAAGELILNFRIGGQAYMPNVMQCKVLIGKQHHPGAQQCRVARGMHNRTRSFNQPDANCAPDLNVVAECARQENDLESACICSNLFQQQPESCSDRAL